MKLAGPAFERTYGQDRKILPIRRDAILEVPSNPLTGRPIAGCRRHQPTIGIRERLGNQLLVAETATDHSDTI